MRRSTYILRHFAKTVDSGLSFRLVAKVTRGWGDFGHYYIYLPEISSKTF